MDKCRALSRGSAMQQKQLQCLRRASVLTRSTAERAPGWLPSRCTKPRRSPKQQKLAATTTASTCLAPTISEAPSLAYHLHVYRGLLAAAAAPILKVGAIGSVGALCSRQGWLTHEGRQMLAKLVVKLFMPALLLDKLGQHVSFQEALELWPIAVNVMACHGVGAALAWAYTTLASAPEPARKAILASAIVGNVGNLPPILAAALLATANDPSAQDAVVRYVMVGWFWANLLQAPIGWLLLHRDNATARQQEQQHAVADVQTGEHTAAAATSLKSFNEPNTPLDSYEDAAEYTIGRSRMSPVIMTAGLWEDGGSYDDHCAKGSSSTDGTADGSSRTRNSSAGILGAARLQRMLQAPEWLPAVTSPCVLAGVAAMLVASTPALRDAIFSPGGSLSLIGDSLDALSQPALVCLMLVLGSNLAETAAPGTLRPIDAVGGVATRLVLLPVVGAALIAATQGAGLLDGMDPVAQLVMMITWATPTALLVHSVASMHQNADANIGALMFYEHAVALLTLPLAMAYIMGECAPGLMKCM